jgi:formamidopyrimidine-DNA glycosylase
LPELPEVETVRRGLEEATRGRAVLAVPWLDHRMVRGPIGADAIRAGMAGQTVDRVERHGKFLVWRFRTGAGLLLHLGMSGRLTAGVQPWAAWPPHTHLVVAMSDGQEVRLRDPRRFGRIGWVQPGDHPWPNLGPDALARNFSARCFQETLGGRQAPIKSLLLDQGVVAGIGNIYADEALFRARIHPLTAGGRLTTADVRRLHRAIRQVLRAAIEHRGTTFRSFEDAAGREGGFLPWLRVYGRTGQACQRCGGAIQSRMIGGRTTHYCERCQPAPSAEASSR